jgi:hypothetical protein
VLGENGVRRLGVSLPLQSHVSGSDNRKIGAGEGNRTLNTQLENPKKAEDDQD